MTKQEKIRESWGDYFDELKYYIDDDGWFFKEHFQFFYFTYDEMSKKIDFIHDTNTNCMRPKSISEFENKDVHVVYHKINTALNLLLERKNSAIRDIELHKDNPSALIIHEQIELMRANDGIELLNSLLG